MLRFYLFDSDIGTQVGKLAYSIHNWQSWRRIINLDLF